MSPGEANGPGTGVAASDRALPAAPGDTAAVAPGDAAAVAPGDALALAPGGNRPGASPWLPAAAAFTVVLATVLVHRRTLGAYFTPDDIVHLASARGLEPAPLSAWRWLSSAVFGALATGPFGLDPRGYHALNLGLLALASALLFQLARRWGASTVAAFAGAAIFGSSRVHFTALASASSHGEFLALVLLLGALLAVGAGRARMRAAAGLLALALSAKESVLLLPLAALLVPSDGHALPAKARRSRIAFVAFGLAAGAALLMLGRSTGRVGGGAYEVAFGGNLAASLFTLLRWSVDCGTPIPDVATQPDPAAWKVGLPALTAIAGLALLLRRRAPCAAAGGAWWLLGVVPVLPLLHQTYLHYLVAPWAGLGLVVAGTLDAWVLPAVARAAPARVGAGASRVLAVACALVLAWALVQDRLLEARWTARLPGGDTPADPVLRKAEYTRRLVTETRSALGGRRARVAYFILEGTQQHLNVRTGESLALPSEAIEALPSAVETTLDGGATLRLLVPDVDSVAFVRRLETSLRGFDCFYPYGDLHLEYLGQPPAALERMGTALVRAKLPGPAVSLLDVATREWPGEPALMWAHAVALARVGARDRAHDRLREIVRIASADSFATLARAALATDAEPGAAARHARVR